ncbi:MAG: hypothetical protein M3394_00145 [Actinomycetota bacterium]|nr:hypothetical protein [Actinomycetota bacterium]
MHTGAGRTGLGEIDRKKARVVHQLEDRDDPDGSVFRAVRERLSELTAERERKLAKLGAILDKIGQGSDADDAAVLDDLPIIGLDDLLGAPEPLLRTVLDALRLRLVYDGRTGVADCTVTVTDDTLTAIWGAAHALSGAGAAGDVPAGLETNGATAANGQSFPSFVRPR